MEHNGASPVSKLSELELSLLQALVNPAFVVDALTRCIIMSNEPASSETGYSHAELEGMKIDDVLRVEGGDSLDLLLKAEAEPEPGSHSNGTRPASETARLNEVVLKRKDGKERTALFSVPRFRRDGKIYFLGGDEHASAEARLQQTELKAAEQQYILERMIDQNPYAIAFWNPDGTPHRSNAAFEHLIGVVPGAPYSILNDPQVIRCGLADSFRQALRGEAVFIERVDYDIGLNRMARKDHKPAIFSVTFFPIFGFDGRPLHVVSIYQDLRKQAEAESKREKLEAQLLQSQKVEAIGTLAGGVAHDFNNLLTGILGYLDLVRTLADPAVKKYIDKIEVAARRGCDLTRQLLAYARKSHLEAKPHDLNLAISEVAALIRQTIDRRIEIALKPWASAVTVMADASQMNQVLMNLCINARDAIVERLNETTTGPGEQYAPRITIETKPVSIGAEYVVGHPYAHEGMHVRMTVADNGTGIAPDVKDRIFEPFFTTKPQGQGTGLGLATIFGIVKQHGGWVEVYSELDQGTVFNIYLPMIDAAASEKNDAGVMFGAPGGSESILLVDDEEMIRDLGRDILEEKGYQVLLASDGREALEIFERHRDEIDLVVLDLTMPRLSGRELLPRLVKMKPDIKVIVSSGYSSDERSDSLLKLGAAAFVQKPYTMVELAHIVRHTLDKRA